MLFSFPINDDFMEILEFAEKNTPAKTYGEDDPINPRLFIVKDAGCYLMAGTVERIPHPNGKPNHSKVLYAEGCGEGVYIGGDDFADPLECENIRHLLSKFSKPQRLLVTLTDTQIITEVVGVR